jgi:hypothetical protein
VVSRRRHASAFRVDRKWSAQEKVSRISDKRSNPKSANVATGARGFIKLLPNWRAMRFLCVFAIRTSHAMERKSYVFVTWQNRDNFSDCS